MPRRPAAETVVPYREALREFKRRYWEELIASTGGNVSAAARIAQVNRCDLYSTFRRYGVELPRRERKRGNAVWQSLGR
jgi:DNA-binding NtrC family response regulator